MANTNESSVKIPAEIVGNIMDNIGSNTDASNMIVAFHPQHVEHADEARRHLASAMTIAKHSSRNVVVATKHIEFLKYLEKHELFPCVQIYSSPCLSMTLADAGVTQRQLFDLTRSSIPRMINLKHLQFEPVLPSALTEDTSPYDIFGEQLLQSGMQLISFTWSAPSSELDPTPLISFLSTQNSLHHLHTPNFPVNVIPKSILGNLRSGTFSIEDFASFNGLLTNLCALRIPATLGGSTGAFPDLPLDALSQISYLFLEDISKRWLLEDSICFPNLKVLRILAWTEEDIDSLLMPNEIFPAIETVELNQFTDPNVELDVDLDIDIEDMRPMHEEFQHRQVYSQLIYGLFDSCPTLENVIIQYAEGKYRHRRPIIESFSPPSTLRAKWYDAYQAQLD